MTDGHLHTGGKGTAVLIGAILAILAFVPNLGAGFLARVGFFLFGSILIGLGVK